MTAAIAVAIIGALGAVVSAYLISRTNKQDRVLERIEVDVNSRLTNALEELQRMQGLITSSRDSGKPVPPRYSRRSTDLHGDEGDPDSGSLPEPDDVV